MEVESLIVRVVVSGVADKWVGGCVYAQPGGSFLPMIPMINGELLNVIITRHVIDIYISITCRYQAQQRDVAQPELIVGGILEQQQHLVVIRH